MPKTVCRLMWGPCRILRRRPLVLLACELVDTWQTHAGKISTYRTEQVQVGHPRSPGWRRKWIGLLLMERLLTCHTCCFLPGSTIKAMNRSRTFWKKQASGHLYLCRFLPHPSLVINPMSSPHTCPSLSRAPLRSSSTFVTSWQSKESLL